MRQRRHHRSHPATSFHLPALMSILVMLVPVVLLTTDLKPATPAIFSLVLPRHPPAAGNTIAPDLHLVIRQTGMTVQGSRTAIREIPLRAGRYDFPLLSRVLYQLKPEYTSSRLLTILAEADIPYETMVAAIAASHSITLYKDGRLIEAELFPEVVLGDAPSR